MSKKFVQIILIVALVATLVGLLPQQVLAHGAMGNPPGRVYVCFLEGPENPDSAACQAAVAAGGTQALYDWNGIRQGNANGNHQALIPDGKLCSANDPEFTGMDLPRNDWPAVTLPTSGNYNWSFRVTAQHMGNMHLYVTKNGYNPTQPLKWSDLEGPFTSFATNTTSGASGSYSWTSAVPSGKSGRHMIYMIWQRTDSMEAFYSCSDVIFGSSGPSATPAMPTRTNTPAALTNTPTRTNTAAAVTNTPTRTATVSGPTSTFTRTPTVGAASATPTRTSTPSGVAAWAANTAYAVNAQVTYGGHTYKCLQAHTSLTGWEPPNVPALWQLIN